MINGVFVQDVVGKIVLVYGICVTHLVRSVFGAISLTTLLACAGQPKQSPQIAINIDGVACQIPATASRQEVRAMQT